MGQQLRYSFPDSSYTPDVLANQTKLEALCDEKNIDAIIITSQDYYLSEYVPLENNPRYALSAFSGSTGNGLFLSRKVAERLDVSQFVLFVDGRYHLQSEQETDAKFVTLKKLTLNQGLWSEMVNFLKTNAAEIKTIAYDAHRLSVSQLEGFHGGITSQQSLESYEEAEIDKAINLPGWQVTRKIFELDKKYTGRDLAATSEVIFSELAKKHNERACCFMTCMTDDLSFVLNTRGYHLPTISSHMGFVFLFKNQTILYLTSNCSDCEVEVSGDVTVIRNDFTALTDVLSKQKVDVLAYNSASLNSWLKNKAEAIWPNATVDASCSVIESTRVAKTKEELDAIRDAFLRSSRAIAETMRWAKTDPELSHTEQTLSDKISAEYQKEGAEELSFTSIAGTGENGAIIHYTKASSERVLNPGELILLDSGAYYEAGFATDCTRGVIRTAGNKDVEPSAWQKEIYTVTLKAAIKGLTARLPGHATGRAVDELVRNEARSHGHDYDHGTGHGVGIHVHEGGIRAGSTNEQTLTPNAVLTIEPGIYLEGKGGVRIENVVIVHAEQDGTRYFENMVFVGYDWDLIDIDKLNEVEKSYLKAYEAECRKRGTTVTECPL